MINSTPDYIVWCYGHFQPLYLEIQKLALNVKFMEGIPDDVDEQFDPQRNNLIIIDDLMNEAGDDVKVSNLFTKGSHHRNLSVVYISQNLFHQGKQNRTMSLNCHYFVLFKNARDKSQIHHLSRQMFPSNPKYLQESYDDATKEPYSYLFIDLKPSTPDEYRLRTHIFPGEIPFVYVPKKRKP